MKLRACDFGTAILEPSATVSQGVAAMRDWFLSDFLEGDAVVLVLENSKGPDWLVSSVRKTQQLMKEMLKILKMKNLHASQLGDLKITAEDAAKNIVAEALLEKLPAERLEVKRNVASKWLQNELMSIDVKMKNLEDKAGEYIGFGGRRLHSLLTYVLEKDVASESFRQTFEYWSELDAADAAAQRLRKTPAGPTTPSANEKENDLNQQNKSPGPSVDVVQNKSPAPSVDVQNKSPAPSVDVQNNSPAPSVDDVQNKSPAPSVDVQNKSPAPSVDVQNKSPEPSVDVLQNKSPAPSVDVQNKSPAPSVDVQNKSPEPSVDVLQNKSPAPSVDVPNKSPEPSVDVQNKSAPSVDVPNKLPEPSVDVQNKSPEPSVDVQNKSPEPSVDVQNKSPEPSVDVQNKSPEPSVDVQNKSAPSVDDVQNKSAPSVDVQNKSAPSVDVQNKSAPSVDVQNKSMGDVQNKPVATQEQQELDDRELTQTLEVRLLS